MTISADRFLSVISGVFSFLTRLNGLEVLVLLLKRFLFFENIDFDFVDKSAWIVILFSNFYFCCDLASSLVILDSGHGVTSVVSLCNGVT